MLKPHPKGHRLPDRKPQDKLTPQQQIWLNEYLKTSNATAAYRRAYGKKKDRATERALAYVVKNRPSMKKALNEAMAKLELDETFVLNKLKKVIVSGEANLGDTQPKDVLKGIEILLKLKGHLAGGKADKDKEEETQLQSMTVDQIAKELKELDKKQNRLLTSVGGSEEGEVIDENPQDKHQ